MENNILSMVMAVLPVLLYSFLVYYIVPEGFLSQRRAKMYIVVGMLAPSLVYAFNYIFPNWHTQIDSTNPLVTFGYQSFFQVALIEETTKFLAFWWLFSQRKNAKYDLPIAVMYYSMMSSAGFAILENITYLFDYGDEVLFIRAISAILVHLLCGIVLGYFLQFAISFRKVLCEKSTTRERNKLLFHKIKFIVLGILASSTFHAIYDFNLFLPFNIYAGVFMFVIIFLGLFIGGFMINDGVRLSKELRMQNYKKDLEQRH